MHVNDKHTHTLTHKCKIYIYFICDIINGNIYGNTNWTDCIWMLWQHCFLSQTV